MLLSAVFGWPEALAYGPVGVRHSHPIDWIYQLPSAETPGWTKPAWVNVQVSESNLWNRAMTVSDRATGRLYEYEMDYQASIAVLDMGLQVLENTAVAIELPYQRRHGGNADQFIEDFHKTFNFFSQLRSGTPDNRSRVRIVVDGREVFFDEGTADGLSSVKLKLKHRVLGTTAKCPCGLALSVQANLPVNGARRMLSSSSPSYSFLAHAGFPIRAESGIYLTTGYTRMGSDPYFQEWPLSKDSLLADVSVDFALFGRWGFIGSFTGRSPLMKSKFDFHTWTADPQTFKHERMASGYNSLFRWRGYQTYGARYRWDDGDQLSVFAFEDFGLGDYDGRNEPAYNNNSPDILIGTQLSLGF